LRKEKSTLTFAKQICNVVLVLSTKIESDGRYIRTRSPSLLVHRKRESCQRSFLLWIANRPAAKTGHRENNANILWYLTLKQRAGRAL